MASRRILNTTSRPLTGIAYLLLLMVTAGVLFGGCGTTRDTGKEPRDFPDRPEAVGDEEAAVSDRMLALLDATRSRLSDVFATQDSEIPEIFTKESTGRDIGDPYQGYRIQLFSTRDVSQADSLANEFRFWAEEVFDEYVPKVYVLFRQPYYKVHIGNFHFQDRAQQLNRFLKQYYPDAWVVPDQIEPNLVPGNRITFPAPGTGGKTSGTQPAG